MTDSAPPTAHPLHPLLARQLAGHFGDAAGVPAELRPFVDAVARAYERADREREGVERALLDVVERFKLIGLATNDTIWEYEFDSGRGAWNEGIHTTFGYAPHQVETAPQWWADRVHPEDYARVEEGIRRAVQGGQSTWSTEYRFRHADGRYVWVLDRAHISRNDEGAPVRVVGAMQDLTDRRRAEEALRASESQFRALAETIAAATFIYQGPRFVYVNRAAQELTGYTAEELLQTNFWDVVHPEHRQAVHERGMARQRGEEVPARYEFRVVRKDGTERWVDFTAGTIPFRGQVAALGTAFDITIHKSAEEVLRRQALTFANLYDAVVITDPEGRITNFNPAAERIYGYSAGEVLGRTVFLWLDPQDAPRVDADIRRALEATGRWEGEIRFTRRDGTHGLSETTVVPLLDARGRQLGALGVSRDITARRSTEEALRSSEERYRLMVEGSEQVFFYVQDAAGRFEYLSPSTRAVLGHDPAELAGHPAHDVLGEDAEDPPAALAVPLREGVSTYHALARHRDGRTVVLELVETPVLRDGAPAGVQGFARDITDRRRAEQAVRESEERYRRLFQESRDAIYMTSVEGRFIDANQATLELFGRTRAQLLAMDAHDIYVHASDRERFQDEITRSGFVRDYEVRLARSDGTVVDCLLSATVRRGADGAVLGYQGIIHDITERKRAEEQLAYGALHDALTGLPNRALFVDRLAHAAERAGRGGEAQFAVLFLDLDRFKVVNDSLGHGVGDELLVALARRLEEALRPGDTVARFGGDEFTLLLHPIASPVEATHVAERLLAALAAPFALERHEVFASASVGIALSSTGYSDPEELLRNADAALSRAKALGKARYEVFDRAMHAQALGRLRMEMDLRRAVERGEFQVFYQPVIDLATGRITGFEGLLRWMHPERGMVGPVEFIPVAEETGLILPLGRWVIDEVCRHFAGWTPRPGRPPVTVGVNLSVKQFTQPDLVQHIERALTAGGMPPGFLKLEITESVILEDAEPAKSMLASLRALGVELYMDDFGTGYSSLGYLHRFPLDALKIDRSFVTGMDHDVRNGKLVQAIIALAHNLGVSVVAEGIDSPAQLAALRDLGCDFGQGYLFSPPVPLDQANAMLARDPVW